MTEGFYLDQKKDSTWVNYNEEGLVLGVESFKKDKLNGKKVIYYLEGQIETEKLNALSVAMYENDTLNGEYKEFFSTGKLKLIGNYENGKLVGEWKEYYPNGVIFKVSKYKDDRLHGWSSTFTKELKDRSINEFFVSLFMLADKIKFAFSFFFVMVIFMSCKKNSQNVQQDWYKSYYDTNEGRFIEYNVHEINHDENAIIQHDTLNYFLRIQIEDTISDNLGRVNRKYVRYKKMNSNEDYLA